MNRALAKEGNFHSLVHSESSGHLQVAVSQKGSLQVAFPFEFPFQLNKYLQVLTVSFVVSTFKQPPPPRKWLPGPESLARVLFGFPLNPEICHITSSPLSCGVPSPPLPTPPPSLPPTPGRIPSGSTRSSASIAR